MSQRKERKAAKERICELQFCDSKGTYVLRFHSTGIEWVVCKEHADMASRTFGSRVQIRQVAV